MQHNSSSTTGTKLGWHLQKPWKEAVEACIIAGCLAASLEGCCGREGSQLPTLNSLTLGPGVVCLPPALPVSRCGEVPVSGGLMDTGVACNKQGTSLATPH